MHNDHRSFYSGYLKEFHQVKAYSLIMQLNNIEQLNEKLKEKEFDRVLTENSSFILQADLRQNYFHAIETFFELFFALIPNESKVPDNTDIVRRLVKSDWRKNYKKIDDIAKGNFKVENLLKRVINFNGHNIEVGHYLFYMGIFNKEVFKELIIKIKESYSCIAEGIIMLAKDFSKNEYNSYKHALRIYPIIDKLIFVDAITKEKRANFDFSNSVSFQEFDEKSKKDIVTTKVFDTKRDFKMTSFCSNLIHHIIYFRDIVYNADTINEQNNHQIKISIFSKEAIDKSSKYNISIKNLELILNHKN